MSDNQGRSSLLKRIDQSASKGGTGAPAGGGTGGGMLQRMTSTGGAGQGGAEGGAAMGRARRAPTFSQVSGRPDVKQLVQQRLLEELGPGETFDMNRSEELRQRIDEIFNMIINEENIVLARPERRNLFESIVAEILGFGPLEPLLEDPGITEIMTVGHEKVYVERKGLIEPAQVHFESEEHLRRIIDRIVAPLGRRIDEQSPMVDARLPDGSRVNAVIRPIAIDGPALTIRKFSK